jgi:hypothetical protein
MVVGRPSRARVEAVLTLGRVGHVARAALVGRTGGLRFLFLAELVKLFYFNFELNFGC